MRPMNCFLITMCAIVGIMVDNGKDTFIQWPVLILIFVGGWALSAAAMVLNDFFDIEIDKINDPQRPIPSGQIKPKQALIFGIVLIVIGLVVGVSIDIYQWFVWNNKFIISSLTAVICAIMLSTYTKYMKRFSVIGNMAVSIGVWLGFLYGDLLFNFKISALPETMAAGAFLLNFGREIAKGIIDIEGDRKNNVNTVATILGPRKTALVASSMIIFLAIPVILIPVMLQISSYIYLIAICLCISIALFASIWLIINQEIKTVKKIKTIILYLMLLCLISFTLEAFFG